MKNMLSIVIAMAILFSTSSCEKDEDNLTTKNNHCENLPHSASPGLAGNWANGFVSMTQLVDVYDGHYVGNAFQSGKVFKITKDGRNAEFYYTAQTQFSKVATRAVGSIAFDPGSTATEGSFTFHACSARYKGWGSQTVDRDATQSELTNSLSSKYFYKMEGQWLRIEPKGPVHQYTSSFKLVN
jgi:hypothetical protein